MRSVRIASSSCLNLCFLLVTFFMVVTQGSHEYKVGDSEGWKIPADNDRDFYETWASKIKFLVGDSIVFEYRNDSVVKVSKSGYYHCNETGRQGSAPKGGSTKFLLDKPGIYYFASGDNEHCSKGQRLMIEVPGLSPSVATSPAPLPNSAMVPAMFPFITAAAVGTWWVSLSVI